MLKYDEVWIKSGQSSAERFFFSSFWLFNDLLLDRRRSKAKSKHTAWMFTWCQRLMVPQVSDKFSLFGGSATISPSHGCAEFQPNSN